MLVSDKASVFVLSLHISINVLHEEQLLKSHPLVEDLLGIFDRESGEVFAYIGIRVSHLACFVVSLEILARSDLCFLIDSHCFFISLPDFLHHRVLPCVDLCINSREHDVVCLVTCVGNPVGHPESGGRGICDHVSVSYAEALGNLVCRSVDRGKI